MVKSIVTKTTLKRGKQKIREFGRVNILVVDVGIPTFSEARTHPIELLQSHRC